jgi:hypothetical protein
MLSFIVVSFDRRKKYLRLLIKQVQDQIAEVSLSQVRSEDASGRTQSECHFVPASATIETVESTSGTARRPTMLYWTSLNGTIFRVETENSDLVGMGDESFALPYTGNRIVGLNLFQFISGLDVSHLYQALAARVLQTGKTINFFYRCDGSRIRREMSMQLSRDGKLVRYESAVLRETWREREIPWETPQAAAFVAMCSFCKNYRYPLNAEAWKELENLLMENDLPGEFRFTHSICDKCYLMAMSDLGE